MAEQIRNRHEPNDKPALISAILFRVAPFFFALAVVSRPIGFSDLGWQLKLGELIRQNGSPWVPEPFAALHLGEPLVPNAWLSQLIFAQVQDAAGWSGLRALDTLLWISGLLVATIPARMRGDRPLGILLALLVGFAVALPAASIRPQSFAAPAFALTLVLIQAVSSRWIVLVIGLPLFVFWQNLHPSVSLAAGILCFLAAYRWLGYFRGAPVPPWTLTILALGASLSILATPAGWQLIDLAAYNTVASKLTGASEWFPLWTPINWKFAWIPLLATVLGGAAVIRRRDSFHAEELVPVVVTLVMTIVAVRFILFFAIAIIPVLSRLPIGGRCRRRRSLFAATSALTWLGVAVAAALMPIRVEAGVPTDAIRILHREGVKGVIFCDPTYGGALIESGFPSWIVAFDGRFYRYDRDEWRLFHSTRVGPVDLPEIIRQYRAEAFVLDRVASRALISALRSNAANWREIYSDRQTAAFIKGGSPSRAPSP